MGYDAAYFDDLFNKTIGKTMPNPAPASTLDAATQAKLAQARAADSAAVEAARTSAAMNAEAPAARGLGVRAAGAIGKLNPAITARGVVGGATKFGRAGLAIAPALGLLSAASDSKEDVAKFGDTIGLDNNTFGGRVGANVVNFLRRTGDAATFGVASRVGRVLTGGNFFDEEPAAATPAAAAPAAQAAPGVVASGTLQDPNAPNDLTGNDGVDTRDYGISGTVENAIRSALTYNPPPPPGARYTRVGPSEQSGGYIEGPNGRVEMPSGTVQRFSVRRPRLADNIDYAIERKASREDQNTRIEGAKLGVALIGAGKKGAEERIASAKLAVAAEYLRKNPTDFGGYAAILAGKDPKESIGTIAGVTGNTSIVTRNGRAITTDANGNVVEKNVYRSPTQADIDKMTKNKNDPTHKASFLAHFGPDAYKTHIEKK